MHGDLRHQPTHVGFADADTINELGTPSEPKRLIFAWPGPVTWNMRGLMVGRVDYETKAAGTVNDDHPEITHPSGLESLKLAFSLWHDAGSK